MTNTTATNRLHLQGIGSCPTIPASDLHVGMFLSWNYCVNGYQIVAIREASAQLIEIDEQNVETGVVYTRRLKKSRLVVASTPAEAAEIAA